MITTQKIRSNVYLDTELKENAKEMFKKYGLSLSDGINFLLKQAMDKKNPMFDLDIEEVHPNDPDYKLMRDADKEKSYPLSEVMKEFGCK